MNNVDSAATSNTEHHSQQGIIDAERDVNGKRKKVKVDYNEKMLRQQYEPMSPQEQYRLKMEALDEIRESGIDYCSCPEQCPHHGKCWECVLIHRGHRDHLPYCMWDMINERLYSLQRLTEGSLMKWTPHEDGFIPRQYGCPPDCVKSEEDCRKCEK